ncbi:MAG TPA: hypothetical protein ENN30_00660 [Candidatus Woesearchaeota archaeon]|nr:hypothetical protein [Candidatus Woesearchaeota archaeon]
MHKKSQAALEYLLTYGWAILIVIIVGASLYALGVFSPGTWTGKRTTGFAQFQIVDWTLQSEDGDDPGTLTLVFVNRLGKTVEVNDIVATYKNEECRFNLADFNVGTNVQITKSKDCTTAWGDLTYRSSYTILLDFEYTDTDSNLKHVDHGTLFGSAE